MTEQEKIRALAGLVLGQRRERLAREGAQRQADAETVEVIPGRKYTKIDRGTPGNMTGCVMVEHGTGIIYGVKGYGVPHKQHPYGTLDTTSEFYWGDL